MPSRPFHETVRDLIDSDADFGAGLLVEALDNAVGGDPQSAKAVLRTYINATVGFVALGEALGRSPKSLMRMLSMDGNPQLKNFFEITSYLQKNAGVKANVIYEKVRKPRKAA